MREPHSMLEYIQLLEHSECSRVSSTEEDWQPLSELRFKFNNALLLEDFWQSEEFLLWGLSFQGQHPHVGFPGWEQLHPILLWNSLGISRSSSVISQRLFIHMDFMLCLQRQSWTSVSPYGKRVDCAAPILPKHWLFQEFSGNFGLKC